MNNGNPLARSARYIMPWVAGFTTGLALYAIIYGQSIWHVLAVAALGLNVAAVFAARTRGQNP